MKYWNNSMSELLFLEIKKLLEYFFSCSFVSISWVVVYFIDVWFSTDMDQTLVKMFPFKFVLENDAWFRTRKGTRRKSERTPSPLTGNYLHGYSYNPAVFIIGYRTGSMQRWERSEIHLKNIIMNDCLKTKYKVKFPLKKNQ